MLFSKISKMSTTLSHSANCVWCNRFMARGEKVWNLKTGKFNKHIRELISRICGKNELTAIGPILHIQSFLVSPPTWRHQSYCTDCGHFDIKFSRSGRTIFTPMRLQDETYVSGSGFGGCDHYDGGYDYGVIKDGKRDLASSDTNLTGFVVDDDEPIDFTMHCKQEISESDEDEWSSDFVSDEEEEFDSDMDWD